MIGSSQLEAPVRTVDHDVCGRKLETDLLRLGHIKAWRPEDYRTRMIGATGMIIIKL